MRSAVPVAVCFVLILAWGPLCAFGHENTPPDQQSIEVLEAKAGQAKARDQCFLYAKIVHDMTELSLHQYVAGNVTVADSLLKEVQSMVKKVHLSLARNDRRLIRAQILLSNTAFRLTEMLHASNYQDQRLVKETLAEVNEAQRETMMQIFQK